MIIHDLRTPLTSVIAGIRTLAVVGELNPSQREMTDVAVSGAEGLLAAINDLLDVERADEDSMPLEYTIFTADELVTEALTQVASLVEAKELTVIHHIAHDLPPLQADERKLVRTLVNLLGNAIKFTPRHGTLSLDVRAEDFSAHFTVSDNGEGIPREALEGIFSKFGQVNHYEGDHPLGHGIGLYFCKMAIEAHNGSIWVESTLGEGSIFHFTIPLVGPES
jgi:signal transduction histidine kinase